MNDFSLKPNFLLGVCDSPTCIDGGDVAHNWSDWADMDRIRDGSHPSDGPDHWERWREDILLMHSLGIQTCRFGLEWARVEPEEGVFDDAAIGRIKEELMLMIALGIRPLVTLQHFTTPMWFEEKGGWEQYDNVRSFLIYAERIVKAIGHLAGEYITLEEPNLYAANAYYFGTFPPGKKKLSLASEVMSNLASAHVKAYRLIHDIRRGLGFRDTRVGVALHLRVIDPKNRLNPAQKAAARQAERLFQTLPMEAMLTGEFRYPLRAPGRERKGTYADFHAVSYYTRSAVSGLSDGVRADCGKNDLGWEIWPEGLTRVCLPLMKLRPMPIYVTACGTCDLNDTFRSRFLYDHLKAAAESRLPIKRFYYDSFLDGFCWQEGIYARFGLVSADPQTGARCPKRSGEFYAKIIRHGGVTEKMYDKYVAGTEYHH